MNTATPKKSQHTTICLLNDTKILYPSNALLSTLAPHRKFSGSIKSRELSRVRSFSSLWPTKSSLIHRCVYTKTVNWPWNLLVHAGTHLLSQRTTFNHQRVVNSVLDPFSGTPRMKPWCPAHNRHRDGPGSGVHGIQGHLKRGSGMIDSPTWWMEIIPYVPVENVQ